KTFDQPHPVFALVQRDVLPHLASFLGNGGRKIDAWYATLAVTEVPFDNEADAFRNINTRAELANSAQQESDIRCAIPGRCASLRPPATTRPIRCPSHRRAP